MGLGPKVFLRKNGTQKGGRLYKWSPDTSNKKNRRKSNQVSGAATNPNYFCVAAAGTQGNDFKTTYSYIVVILDGIAKRHAYVQCDYVQ